MYRCVSTPVRSARPSAFAAADSWSIRMNIRSRLKPVVLTFARLLAITSMRVILGRMAASDE